MMDTLVQTAARYPGTLSPAQAERGCQLLYNSSDTKGVGWVSTHTLLTMNLEGI